MDKINLVFEGKIGKSFNDEELKKIYTEGAKRYNDKIPPGFCDIKKPENEKYGDLILWKQIILKAKDDKIDIIFILDDRKDDWWLEYLGKTISPRPELLKEFWSETNRKCHFYKPFQFLEYSNEYIGNTIIDEIIEEVKNYNPNTFLDEKYINLHLTIKGTISDFNILIDELKNANYNIFTNIDNTNNLHELFIILPNFSDLVRRITIKYISRLADYNLILIDTSVNFQNFETI